MNNSLFQGSCHCGRINFQVKDTNISEDLYKCNCSLCKKKGIVMKPLDKDLFKLTKGEEFLSSYKWNKLIAEHFFCKICEELKVIEVIRILFIFSSLSKFSIKDKMLIASPTLAT